MKYLMALCFVLLLNGCGESLCDNILSNESKSADGKYIATTFIRSCGATTPYITVVSLRKASTKLDMEEHENWVFTAHDKATIEIKWGPDNNLLIDFSSSDKNATMRDRWKDLVISYKRESN